MKNDLDHLMEVQELDAVIVGGHVHNNPPLYYLTNGASLGDCLVVKRRGESPVLIAKAIEREMAAASGLPVIVDTRYDFPGLLKAYQGDHLKALIAYYQRIFEEQGVQGRVGFYGMDDRGHAYAFLSALNRALPEIEVIGELHNNIFTVARATKSPEEVARIREAGRRTVEIVQQTLAFLQQHTVGEDELLYQPDGSVLTVGDVHAHIGRLIALHNLEDPEGFIFSTGRDAGVPHNRGDLSKPMRLGESIIFDIFPREAGGGYFFDMTRTFCLGYAPEAVARLYDDTFACLQTIFDNLAVGEEARRYQQMACDFYSRKGHPTIAGDPRTVEGYVHSLGHGVGLDVHESPFLSDAAGNEITLQPGHVFTVEPGLYYPDQGMGCRLEDIIWVDEAGTMHNLTQYPYQLVVPMGGN